MAARLRHFLLTTMAFMGLAAGVSIAQAEPTLQPPLSWVLYTGKSRPHHHFYNYDPVVFHSDHHPSLRALADRGKQLLARLPLSSITPQQLQTQPQLKSLLMAGQSEGDGVLQVQRQNPRWIAYVIEQRIPQILRRGFHGLYLPDITNLSPNTGDTNPNMVLLRTIRYHYPQLLLMAQASELHLETLASQVKMVVWSITEAQLTDPQHHAYLKQLIRRTPMLHHLALIKGAASSAQLEPLRQLGLHPYVSNTVLEAATP
ncbi:hypothetical protein [Magnetococcus sp. PR-3]|uniref:hypothetical protein n=1 Tax=Magnetococcus sp. PR-3 TaxID=3120355 RepID=UPI002FCE0F4D